MSSKKEKVDLSVVQRRLVRIDKKLRQLGKERERVLEEQLEIIKHKLFRCKCGGKVRLSELVFIQKACVVVRKTDPINPKTKDCHIVCPKCDERIPLSDLPKITDLIDSPGLEKQELFREIIYEDCEE